MATQGTVDLIELGERVKAARRERRITRDQMAVITGVSRSRVEAFEHGRAPEIAFASVVSLMNAVGLDLRPTTLNHGRPTLDELVTDREDDADAPGLGR